MFASATAAQVVAVEVLAIMYVTVTATLNQECILGAPFSSFSTQAYHGFLHRMLFSYPFCDFSMPPENSFRELFVFTFSTQKLYSFVHFQCD